MSQLYQRNAFLSIEQKTKRARKSHFFHDSAPAFFRFDGMEKKD